MTVIRLIEMGYRVTAWFMNPNIHPLAEYLRRREAMEICAERLKIDVIWEDSAWDLHQWLRDVEPLMDIPPKRCAYCCSTRTLAVAQKARELGFSYFSTSLLYSKYQPHELIKKTGEIASGRQGYPLFVYRDFREDWQAGIDISKEWGIYRQPYCGCIYSETDRYSKKLRRLIQKSDAR